MKRILFIAIMGCWLVIAGCSGTEQTVQAQEIQPSSRTEQLLRYQDEITVDFLRKHLSAFAADSMMGRETGTPGQKKAARYLAHQYRQMGLQPVGDDSTYFQNFKLNATQLDSIVFSTWRGQKDEKKLINRSVAHKNATAPFIRQFGSDDTLSGNIVFAGFGIQNEEMGVNQLEGIDLQGKWVMIFEDVPQVVNGDTLYQDMKSFSQSWLGNILQRGVAGVLMIPDMTMKEYRNAAQSDTVRFGKPSGMELAYRSKGRTDSGPGWSYNLVSPAYAASLLGAKDLRALEARKQKVARNMTTFTPQKTNYRLRQIPYSSEVKIETENVLAFFEGTDPQLKDEVVVLTSHYDHVGVGRADSTGDHIYNGADDDGSGTVGLLNIAHAFREAAQNGVRPKRSILFLNVTGEEKGLLGSRYYSDHPVFPIKKTIANLNTDMIGRIDKRHEEKGVENYVYIIGAELISSQLDSLIKAANRRSGQLTLSKRYNDLHDPNQFYRRSDHWNFGRLGVPFAFFFSGVHEDYHQPSDEVHKIRFDKMAKIVRTMYASAVLLANTDQPPTVDNQAFIRITKGQ